MWKKFLPVLSALLLAGCASQFTRLTPLQQPRNPNNLYPVEVAFNSSQQSLRWETIQPYVIADGQSYPLRPVALVRNRWEGFVPVPAGVNFVNYRFKFDYKYNAVGTGPKANSVFSPVYKLTVVDQ
ncbi:MAG TPA: hypothetical protein VMB80_09625 [Candidatus Acidoferrum sp.]|nr:hypothetical protein [Candidatus Acidoferrum sp.]